MRLFAISMLGLVPAFGLVTKQIGPGRECPTFKAAAESLAVWAPLSDDYEFLAAPGTYQESVAIRNISANNHTVTFQRATNDSVVVFSSRRCGFYVDSAPGMVFNGLTVKMSYGNGGRCFYFRRKSHGGKVLNCNIATIGNSGQYGVRIDTCDYCRVEGCSLAGCRGAGEGVHLQSADYGAVIANRIRIAGTGGIVFDGGNGDTACNNLIVGWANDAVGTCGIQVSNSSNTGLFYNTVVGPPAGGIFARFGIYLNAASSVESRDNIVYVRSANQSCCYYCSNNTTFKNSNYNDLYRMIAGSYTGFYNSGMLKQTLADWRLATNQDTSSIAWDPVFVSLDSGDLHIQGASPCRDSGITISGYTTDIDGDGRPQGSASDIGADEYCPTGINAEPVNPGGRLTADGGQLEVAPNPCTDRTTVSCALPAAGKVALKLFDVTGKLVTILAQGPVSAGKHEWRLGGFSLRLARGVYVLRLETRSATTTRKLIVE
jgi:hypothetical protein